MHRSLVFALVPICALILRTSTAEPPASSEPASSEAKSITDFQKKENKQMAWKIVDDGVMGGLSQGKLSFAKEGVLSFSGILSLENNGGFSSLRTGDIELDLGKADGLLVRVRGDGRTYQMRLGTDARFRGMEVSFGSPIATTKDEWIEVKLPFTAFSASFRGLQLPEEKLDPSKIARLGLLLGDKKAGQFALDVDWIRTYTQKE